MNSTPVTDWLPLAYSKGVHCRVRRKADYSTRAKVMEKVLDFVRFG